MQKPYSSAFAKHYRRQTFPIYGARLVFKFILCGSSRSVCVCVYVFVCACVRVGACLPPRLLITSGMIWTSYD